MYVAPSWLVATPWLVPILLRPLVKVRGSSPRKGSSPLLIVPTPEGWKAEYTLASRMQIHESLTALALLTRGEARTSDPWICSLMLDHLSYLTKYIHTYVYIHTYIHIQLTEFNWLPEQTPEDNNLTGRVQHITEEPEPTITSPEDNNLSGRGQQLNETSETGDNYERRGYQEPLSRKGIK